jgi:hypothetical protein
MNRRLIIMSKSARKCARGGYSALQLDLSLSQPTSP